MHRGYANPAFLMSGLVLAFLGCAGCVDLLPALPDTEETINNAADDASAGVATGVLGDTATSTDAPVCVEVGQPASDMHLAMYEALNEYRVANGLSPLIYSKTLEAAADAQAVDLWQRSFFAHVNPDGENPGQRAVAAGFCHEYVGENLAAGQNTLEKAMTAWKNSPGHNANMLQPAYIYVGVSYSVDTNGRYYWAQELAYELP
jgi:uncharacterized protein YkwD